MSEDFDQTPAPKSFLDRRVKGTLPFSRWWPIFAGAIVGILIRFVFSEEPGQSYSAMRAVFIIFSPLAVAAVTVYWPRQKHAGVGATIWQQELLPICFLYSEHC